MNSPTNLITKNRVAFITGIAVALIGLFFLAFYAVFGRALQQGEDNTSIMLSLPRALLSSEAVKVNQTTYIAKSDPPFVKEMQRQGYTEIDQLGLYFLFEKDGKRYSSNARQYSSYFILFSQPWEQAD